MSFITLHSPNTNFLPTDCRQTRIFDQGLCQINGLRDVLYDGECDTYTLNVDKKLCSFDYPGTVRCYRNPSLPAYHKAVTSLPALGPWAPL